MSKDFLGILLAVIALLFFSIVYAFYKASQPFLSTTQILFITSSCSWIAILPFVLSKGFKFLPTKHFYLFSLRTLLGLATAFCITKALTTISLSEALLLSNTSPLFIPFIVLIWHKTKISHRLWTGLIIGFIGVFIVLQPGFEKIGPGQILGLLSGLTSAMMLVVIKQFAHEPLLRIMFYYFLIIALVLSPSLFFIEWHTIPPIVWLYLVLGALIMIGAQVCLTTSFRFASSHEIAPFVYTSVIFGGLIDWIVWHNKPGLITLLGMVVVCIGGIITLLKGATDLD